MNAISLFSGAGGMDIGFERAGVSILWANEFNSDAVETYRTNHPHTYVEHADIREAKKSLHKYSSKDIQLVFGGPPCQGFSVAGKMDPTDERSTMIWEFFDVVEMVSPQFFVMENVKALGELTRWKQVRNKIFNRAKELGYYCFSRILNAADFGVPQKRERVFFIGVRSSDINIENAFDAIVESKKKPRSTLRDCLLSVGVAGTPENPLSCTAKISLATNPVIRKSPYAGMLFNGMGRPLDFEGQSNTLPASMGGNKTPIVDERLLHDPSAEKWVEKYHESLVNNSLNQEVSVPNFLRRLTIKEAAAIQTFPPDYIFRGGKSSIYRQIGNAVPCNLAQCVAETVIELESHIK